MAHSPLLFYGFLELCETMEIFARIKHSPAKWLLGSVGTILGFLGATWCLFTDKTIPALFDEGGWKAMTILSALWLFFFLFSATVAIQLPAVRALRFGPKGTRPMTWFFVIAISSVVGAAIWWLLPVPHSADATPKGIAPSLAPAASPLQLSLVGLTDTEARARLSALEMQNKVILSATAAVSVHVAHIEDGDPGPGWVVFHSDQSQLIYLESPSVTKTKNADGSILCSMQCELGPTGLGWGRPKDLKRTLPWILDAERIDVKIPMVYPGTAVLGGEIVLLINGDFPLTFTIPAQKVGEGDEGIHIRDLSAGLKPLRDATQVK